MRRSALAAVAAIGSASLLLSACSKADDNGGDESKSAGANAATKDVVNASTQKGGTVTYELSDVPDSFDPGNTYYAYMYNLSRLYARPLMTFKPAPGEEGNTLVPDLAASPGEPSDGGKTWTYKLKDNIKDEDGNAITSADIRHTIERQYSKVIFDGPTYIQTWLSGADYRKELPDGPYKGKHLPDSVLETPDDKTVVFHFDQPRPDLPQALAMAGYAIVPEKADTKEKYDDAPKSLGPYKIAEYKPGKSMKLVKNDQWDAKTDSVRHQYVDGYNFSSTIDQASQTKRLIADQGEAKNAIQFTDSVDPAQMSTVIGDANAKKRTIQGYQPYVWQLTFNLDRVKDKKIRDAITYAIPNQSMVQADGGRYGGEVAGGLLAPTLPNFDPEYDPFGKLKKPNGDIEKAKQLLKEAGVKEGTKLTYAYSNTPRGQAQQVIIKDALAKIGLDVQAKEIDRASFYEQVGKLDNPYDIYMTGWGQDWSSPSTVITPVYDGTQVQDGASNYSHIDDKQVNELIEKALTQQPEEAAKTWEQAHHRIVEEINPAAPVYFSKQIQLYGSNIGGAKYSNESSYIDINDLYLKKP